MSAAHDAVGSFAVDALEPVEVDAFLAHHAHCPTCRQDTLDFAETTAQLSLLAIAAPPPRLRAAVLDEIRQIRPLPPLVGPREQAVPVLRLIDAVARGAGASRNASRTEQAGNGYPLGFPGSSAPLGAAAPAPGRNRRQPVAGRSGWSAGRALTLVAAALVVITLGSLTGLASSLRTQSVLEADSARRTQLLAAPDAHVLPASLAGSRASFVTSAIQDRALFLSPSLPPPGDDRVYQLWLIRDGRPIPDAVLRPEQTSAWLQGTVRGAGGAAVSVEPLGGSPDATPTTVVGQVTF